MRRLRSIAQIAATTRQHDTSQTTIVTPGRGPRPADWRFDGVNGFSCRTDARGVFALTIEGSPLIAIRRNPQPQALGRALRAQGSDGITYPSVLSVGGERTGLLWLDIATDPRQGRPIDGHWDDRRVDRVREPAGGIVWRECG
jgi:hypothetical protein